MENLKEFWIDRKKVYLVKETRELKLVKALAYGGSRAIKRMVEGYGVYLATKGKGKEGRGRLYLAAASKRKSIGFIYPSSGAWIIYGRRSYGDTVEEAAEILIRAPETDALVASLRGLIGR